MNKEIDEIANCIKIITSDIEANIRAYGLCDKNISDYAQLVAAQQIKDLINSQVIEELTTIKGERGVLLPYSGKQLIGFGDGIRFVYEKIDERIDTLKGGK